MNIIDIIILLITAVFLIRGISRGVVKEVGTILGMSLAFTVATQYIETFSAYISKSSGLTGPVATVLAYVVLLIGVFIILSIILGSITKLIRMTSLGSFDKIGGAAIGLFLGTLLSSMMLVVLSMLPFSKNWITGQTGSVLYPYVVEVAPRAYGLLSGMNPETGSFYEKFNMLNSFDASAIGTSGGADGNLLELMQSLKKLDPREAKRMINDYQKLERGQGDSRTTYDEALKMLGVDTATVDRKSMDDLLKNFK